MYKDVFKWISGCENKLCTLKEETINQRIAKEIFSVIRFNS